jgi:hypothetical protein
MTDFKSDDYQEGQQSQGLGDSIAKFTHLFRINNNIMEYNYNMN